MLEKPKKKIAILIQARQHYHKLYPLALKISPYFEVTFIIDPIHIDFGAHFDKDADFQYLLLSSGDFAEPLSHDLSLITSRIVWRNFSLYRLRELLDLFTRFFGASAYAALRTYSKISVTIKSKVKRFCLCMPGSDSLIYHYKKLRSGCNISKQHKASPIREAIKLSLFPIVKIAKNIGSLTGEVILKYKRKTKINFRSTVRYIYYPLQGAVLIIRTRKFLKKHQFDALIIAEANVEYSSEALIKCFHGLKAPTIIYPYTFCSPKEPANYYKKSSIHRYRKAFSRMIHKKWIYEYEGRKMIRVPITSILAIEAMNIAPPMPWVLESSTATAIVAESIKVLQHYTSQGIPNSQIAVIGDINHDIMQEALKNRAVVKAQESLKLGLNPDRKITLFGLFPDYVNYLPGCEFPHYLEMLQYIIDQLSQLHDTNLIISLHPSLKHANYTFLERDGVKISIMETPKLLAISDLYIASVSATIKMAIALGVPVINYDVYKFRYGDYLDVGGVLNLETKAEFEQAIHDLNTTDLYTRMQKSQEQVKEEWGVIDGKATERFVDLINNLMEKKACVQ